MDEFFYIFNSTCQVYDFVPQNINFLILINFTFQVLILNVVGFYMLFKISSSCCSALIVSHRLRLKWKAVIQSINQGRQEWSIVKRDF